MPSESVLDIDALLAPIPGDDPAGSPLPFGTRKKLEEARKEVDPRAFRADDPMRPTAPVVADWPAIIKLAQETLTKTSKDLLVAARLTEALTKVHGFPGARDGLSLLHRLIDECWDAVQPVIEDGDVEVRAAAFNWLDDTDRGSRFPNTLQGVPLISDDEDSFGLRDWKTMQAVKCGQQEVQQNQAEEKAAGPSPETFNKAVAATSRERCQTTVDDLADCLLELDGLVQSLQEKMGNEQAPGLVEVRKALVECQDLAKQILARKGPAPIAMPEPGEEPPAEEVVSAEAGQRSRATPMNSREEVYATLERASAQLLQMEPHSPIAYMIQRAVRLARLPLPELLKILIRDPNTLTQLDRDLDLGIGNGVPE